MNIRPALKTGGSLALGVLALGAVRSGLALSATPGRGTPSAGWAPMPDPAGGSVTGPPFPANLTAEGRAHLDTFDTLDFEVFTTHDWARLAESHAPNIRGHFPGKGGTIAPTGKAFAVDMVAVGIWNRQGTMDEEFLLWDNQAFYGEMGLG